MAPRLQLEGRAAEVVSDLEQRIAGSPPGDNRVPLRAVEQARRRARLR